MFLIYIKHRYIYIYFLFVLDEIIKNFVNTGSHSEIPEEIYDGPVPSAFVQVFNNFLKHMPYNELLPLQ